MSDLRDSLLGLVQDGRAITDLPLEAIPQALGALRSIEVALLARQFGGGRATQLQPKPDPGRTAPGTDDRWLTPEEAAELLRRDRRWIYRQARRWTFAKRPTRKTLLISERGLLNWMQRQ
jgi:Helix-turn-helix domain